MSSWVFPGLIYSILMEIPQISSSWRQINLKYFQGLSNIFTSNSVLKSLSYVMNHEFLRWNSLHLIDKLNHFWIFDKGLEEKWNFLSSVEHLAIIFGFGLYITVCSTEAAAISRSIRVLDLQNNSGVPERKLNYLQSDLRISAENLCVGFNKLFFEVFHLSNSEKSKNLSIHLRNKPFKRSR